MSEILKLFGPWAVILLAMVFMLKFLVTDKLKTILEKLEKVDEHEVKLERISTAMEMNGCMTSRPSCGRRMDDR